jgi:hypothetical protein
MSSHSLLGAMRPYGRFVVAGMGLEQPCKMPTSRANDYRPSSASSWTSG